MWHYTKLAKRELKDLATGYESEDKKLSSTELSRKYNQDILESKSANFRRLPLEKQKDLIYAGITGKETKISKKFKEASGHGIIKVLVNYLKTKLIQIGRYNEWLKNSCDYKTFLSLPLEEKKKFHNAMVNFHDQCLREKKENGQSLVPDQVLDSSPTDQAGDCPPNFDDSSKWTEVKK